MAFIKVINCRWSAICVSLIIVSSTSYADYYRTYVNGAPVLSQTISRTHIENGYEILNQNMQVTKKVQPFSASQSLINQQKLQQKLSQQLDERKLTSTYGSSNRAKTRKAIALNNLSSKITIAQQTQHNLRLAYKQSVSSAANYERMGKPIPATLKTKIKQLDEQIKASQEHIITQQQTYKSKELEYDEIIVKLEALEAKQ